MKFEEPSLVLNCLYDAWWADQGRATNRARIQDKANGFPPWTQEEADAERFVTNVNFLEMCSLLQSARRQFQNAYLKPGRFFTVNLDYGPQHKRAAWGTTITNKVNRAMKTHLPYMETLRSEFANVALHGIGPSFWQDRFSFCPEAIGVEDVLIPSGTRLVMDNLPWFGVWRQYTAMELYKKTHGPRVDKGWNLTLVENCLKWARDQYQSQPGYSQTFSPEKISEQFKESMTAYPMDSVPTIDCWVFFFYDDEGDHSGWKQRIVLDNFAGGNQEIDGGADEWLYNPGDRRATEKRENAIHFSFGDLSAKAPFMYHSVRSLGYLLYSVCQLQDRLQCRLNDAAFEGMMNYYRVSNPEDAERVQKIDLVNKGILPEGVDFVKSQDRWNVNSNLAEFALGMNRQIISEHSASYVQDFDRGEKKDARETATKTQQRAQQASAMVGAMLGLSYEYQLSQYTECCRRLCIPNSPDFKSREFRLDCLRAGVPEEALNVDRWDIVVERVLGGGNKAVELAQIGNLMATRPLYDPDAQRSILRLNTLAQTDDPGLTEMLVPASPLKVTDTVHDAELAAGTLMMGLPVSIRTGQNHTEYVGILLRDFGILVQKVMTQQRGVATPDQIQGFQNLAQHIGQHIALLAQQGPAEKQHVKQMMDVMGKLMNAVKGMMQRLQEQMKAQAQAGAQGGADPKDAAKLQFEQAKLALKLQAQKASHAQRLQQRNQEFMAGEMRSDIEHGLNIRQKLREHSANLMKTSREMAMQKPETAGTDK